MTPKFQTGILLSTPNVLQWGNIKFSFQVFVEECLIKHSSGDWGDLEQEDKDSNDFALENNERILSAYSIPENFGVTESKIWIITEYDRKTTTILFPNEY